MKKKIKIVLILFIGLILWGLISYFALAFYEMELNPDKLSKRIRAAILFSELLYLCFIPLLYNLFDEKVN